MHSGPMGTTWMGTPILLPTMLESVPPMMTLAPWARHSRIRASMPSRGV